MNNQIKKVRKLVTQIVNEKRRCRDGNTFLKSKETRDELSITLYLQSEIYFCSIRMPVNT